MKNNNPKSTKFYSTLIPILAGLLAGLADYLFNK
jgi:hypothetical protein